MLITIKGVQDKGFYFIFILKWILIKISDIISLYLFRTAQFKSFFLLNKIIYKDLVYSWKCELNLQYNNNKKKLQIKMQKLKTI